MTAFVAARSPWSVVLRLALRDLRGGLSGFRVFIACLALGVAAIAGVGSIARGLSDGIAREGRAILGGDAAFSLIHREASAEERAFLEARGRLGAAATMRAMARTATASALTELKAVDSTYPMVGAVTLRPETDLAAALAPRDGVFGAVAEPGLLARLGVAVGDEVTLGERPVQIRAELVREPDALAGGIGFGPRLIVSDDALRASGLLQPGSLVRWTYRLVLPADRSSDAALRSLVADVRAAFPEAGFQVRSRTEAAPQFERNIDRFTQFLTIIGLTALIVGGVGVANAVTAYIDRKRDVIATLKCLGATGGRVFSIYFAEIGAIALVGIAIGLALGAALPFVLVGTLGSLLPLPLEPSVYARELLLAVVYGLLTATTFAIWPLGRVREISVASLYRERVAPTAGWPARRFVAATAIAAALLAGLSIFAAYDRWIAFIFALSAGGTFLALRLVAAGIMAGARALPRPRSTELRLAITNLYRPGALTPSVVLSLGLGLALLVALTLIDSSIRAQLTQALPERAPSFFFVDLPSRESQRFDALIEEAAPQAEIERVPMLRGTFVRLKGVPVADMVVEPDMRWALRGDRGVTYATALPESSRVVAGAWWPADHRGDNLVSMEDRFAEALGLQVGDEITVNVLGRNITARIANLRNVRWQTLGINFFMIFSPNTFAGAPHMDLATVTWPQGATQEQELALLKRVTDAFPAITAVRVKDALNEVDAIVANLALAVQAASSITLIASVLVLAGALAAGHRQRLYDAVVLKTLGATRGRLLLAYGLEYALVGAVTAVFGLVAGAIAAAVIANEVMNIDFAFSGVAPLAAFGALAVTVVLGLLGTFRILGETPARHLKSL